MLCKGCEEKFNKWETPAAKVWDKITEKAVLHTEADLKDIFFNIDKVEYTPLKLYFLSLLWRMGVSELPHFQFLNLKTHERALRRMLVEGDPGRPHEYPFLLMVPKIQGEWREGWMLPPETFSLADPILGSVINARTAVRLVVNGIICVFGMPSFTGKIDLSQLVLNEKGEMKVFIRDMHELPYIRDCFIRMIQAANVRDKEQNAT